MPRICFPRSRVLYAAALTVGAFMACESPFEPRGEGERVPIGFEITDDVGGDTVARYSFVAESGGAYAVFLDAIDGTVQLNVIDSTHQYSVAFLVSGPTSPPLYQNPTSTFSGAAGVVYQLRVTASPGGTHARFRFIVYRINTAPELLSDVFAFGDTVSGETIDPMVDLDGFHAHGIAGQEIVAVVEPQGPAGSGSVGLSVIDQSANVFLGFVFADAGTTNRLTTGRMRLEGTHDYLFGFGSVTSNQYPRYRGAYRFWTYVINRAPEHRAAAIPFNTEIGNERIDRAGDVDEFTFQATAGAEFNAFLQGGGRTFQLEVARQGGTPFAAAASQPSDTALFAHATNRFQITAAGTHVLQVTGSNPSQVADTGAYRLYLYAIDPRPEHVPAPIVPGDTVSGEDIARPGDVDEFTFNGAVGEEFNVFLQAQDGSPNTSLRLEVVDVGGTVIRLAQSTGIDTSLLRQPTGRFALTSAGTYRLRVSGIPSYLSDLNAGAYRLSLYRVDRRPESVPVDLSVGDSMSGESIDMPGDADEYRVVVGETTGVNLVATLDAQPDEGTPVTVQLFDSNGVQVAGLTSNIVPTSAGRVQLVPGVYKLRVDVTHYQDKPTFRGHYRLWLYSFGFAPELVSDTFAIGDTVSGEGIAPWGDFDRFHFYGLRGQHINVALQGLADTSGGGFQAWITGPAGFASVSSAASDATLRDHQTMRLDLPATGWYHVEMTGFGSTRGVYRLLVESLSAAPEQASAALTPGDSVTTESLDTPGDWDEFTVTATPGQELNVIFEGNPAMNGYAQIRVRDAATGDSLAGNVGQGTRIVGPIRVPASGQVTIAVYQDAGFIRFCYDATCSGILTLLGPYAFHVDPLNRGPESVPAAYTVGDTVRGDAVTPMGDIDEFSSSGTPGEVLTPFLRLIADPVPVEGLIMLEVVDPSTGANLAGGGWALFRTTTEFLSPGNFTVPAGGAFIVRVKGYGSWGTGIATAPYEMFVKR